MTNWSSGYVSDIGYTYGYYTELNPSRVNLAFLNAGLDFPYIETACELGFGQGLSTNIHAAATLTEWHGTDFNPSQAGFAQKLAAISGSGARLLDEAFVDFAERRDLPDFDFIGLHGIWSWISEDNMKVIIDFVSRKLKVGGVLYISYNTLPGWAAFAPIRHLMVEHAEIIGSEGRGIVSRVNDAIAFARQLLLTNPNFSKANPLVGDRLEKLEDQNRHYIAHEYFNRDWYPMHFSTIAQWLEPAKLQYACSAHYIDNIDGINLTQEQIKFLQEIPDPMFRESVRDFMVNQQFRRDYWVKGRRQLNSLERVEKLRQQKVVLTQPRSDIVLKVSGALGGAKMNEAVYDPILNFLADHKICTFGQIEQAMKERNLDLSHVMQAVMLLTGSGSLSPALEVENKSQACSNKLNFHLIDKARGTGDISYLASPVTGGGIFVGRFEQLFLLAINLKKSSQPSDWAQYTWNILKAQGQKLIKKGQTLEADTDNLKELTCQAQEFLDKRLPVLRALKIMV